jgi:CRISPR-associated protein Cas1
LIVEEYGAFISKHSERIIVKRKDEKLAQAPLLHLESVLIASAGVSISADAVRECTERGIPIHFISGTGTPYASLYSAGLTGTVRTRRAQLAAMTDRRGLVAALAFITGKLQNKPICQIHEQVPQEAAPDLCEESAGTPTTPGHLVEIDRVQRYPEVQDGTPPSTICAAVVETRAVRHKTLERHQLVPPDGTDRPGRRGRGAPDPITGALNYGYGICTGGRSNAPLCWPGSIRTPGSCTSIGPASPAPRLI